MLKIHCLRHEPFESAGVVEAWAKKHHHSFSETHVYKNEILPAVNNVDWLVILGGGMSVNDEGKYSWMTGEKEFIRKCIDKGKIVLGICLGAQLVANVLGAKVYRNKQKEIGWFQVKITKHGLASDLFQLAPDEFLTFHWHGETFDMPKGALRLAYSEACLNQAFTYGSNVAGIQFHMEMTERDIEKIVPAGKSELIQSKYIQSADFILENSHFATAGNRMLTLLLDAIFERTKIPVLS